MLFYESLLLTSTVLNKELPGERPQRVLLGSMIFFVKFNGAALWPQIPKFVFLHTIRIMKATGVKFVDDFSVAVSVSDIVVLLYFLEDSPPCHSCRLIYQL